MQVQGETVAGEFLNNMAAQNNPATVVGSGVGIFGYPVFDTKRKLMFMGTGGNDELPFTDDGNALLALNYHTKNPAGEIVWFVQFSPQGPGTIKQFWDVSDCHLMNICDYPLVLCGEKNGTYHALKPKNGERVWDIRIDRPHSSGESLRGCQYKWSNR